MNSSVIAMFGEAERGKYRCIYYCQTVPQLHEYFGHPPPESQGIFCAIQALLYEIPLVFIRVREEGYSQEDYLIGLKLLAENRSLIDFSALFAPGVGDPEIVDDMVYLCQEQDSILITTESDLYDYMTYTTT